MMVKWRIAFMKNSPFGYTYLNAIDKAVALTRARGRRSCCEANVIFASELLQLNSLLLSSVRGRWHAF